MKLSPGMVYLNLSIYTMIFILFIPAIFFKLKYFTFLEAYMPNLDLIATILTFNKLSFHKLYYQNQKLYMKKLVNHMLIILLYWEWDT